MKKILLFLVFNIAFAESSLIKQGFYWSLGPSISYFNYNEFESAKNNAFFMRMDTLAAGINAGLGFVLKGFKGEINIDSNIGAGLYTGGDFYTEEKLYSFEFHSFHHADVILGYDVLSAFDNISLYLQSGFSYLLTRNESSGLERIQGYLSVPFGIEGQIGINDTWSFDYMGRYNLFLFGHHLSYGNAYGMSGNLDVIQKIGWGAKAMLGFSRVNKDSNITSYHLVYEYFYKDDSPSSPYLFSYIINGILTLYEPRSTQHIFTFECSFRF